MENGVKRPDSIDLRAGNISLILDSYDDLFSDFDPRPYSQRALSDDFLFECKKATRDKEAKLELRFIVPKQKRDMDDEIKIKRRLREHFQRHYQEYGKEINKVRFQGILWFILGAILMAIGMFIFSSKFSNDFFNFLIILIEPASWFFFWEGLNTVFKETKEKLPDYNFYRKMSNLEISFIDY